MAISEIGINLIVSGAAAGLVIMASHKINLIISSSAVHHVVMARVYVEFVIALAAGYAIIMGHFFFLGVWIGVNMDFIIITPAINIIIGAININRIVPAIGPHYNMVPVASIRSANCNYVLTSAAVDFGKPAHCVDRICSRSAIDNITLPCCNGIIPVTGIIQPGSFVIERPVFT